MASLPEALCTSCGLCCDGTLFASVPLDAGERERVAGWRLPVVGVPEELPLPCPALEATRCARYEERPAACRRFECMLLRALGDGEVSLPEALATVDEARVRTAALQVPLASARREVEILPPRKRDRLLSLETFLDRRFRSRSGWP